MKSFLYALRGVGRCVKTQRNMRIHLCFAFYVVLAALVTKIEPRQWCAIIICIGAVTGAECVNTAIESLCDALHPGRCAAIGACKDAAAGAVLLLAAASAVVGGLIFFRTEPAFTALAFAREHKPAAAGIALSLIPAVLFVKGAGRKGMK